jgi:hypothetical protein
MNLLLKDQQNLEKKYYMNGIFEYNRHTVCAYIAACVRTGSKVYQHAYVQAARYISLRMYRQQGVSACIRTGSKVCQHAYVQAQKSHDNRIFTELWHFVYAQCFNLKSALDKSLNNAIHMG